VNEFNYLDIYATKHIEYLWVIGFLVVFVGLVLLERRARARTARKPPESGQDREVPR
jgi:hypothetical protein